MTICDGLIGVVGAVVTGSLLAVAVAVGLSPLAPIGPVRSVYPDRGVASDWTVLGLGFVLLVVVLSGSAVAVAYRASPHRASRPGGDVARGFSGARAAAVRVLKHHGRKVADIVARRVRAHVGRLAAAIGRTPKLLVTSAQSGWVARPRPCGSGSRRRHRLRIREGRVERCDHVSVTA